MIPPSLRAKTMKRKEDRIDLVGKELKGNIRELSRDRQAIERKEKQLVRKINSDGSIKNSFEKRR